MFYSTIKHLLLLSLRLFVCLFTSEMTALALGFFSKRVVSKHKYSTNNRGLHNIRVIRHSHNCWMGSVSLSSNKWSSYKWNKWYILLFFHWHWNVCVHWTRKNSLMITNVLLSSLCIPISIFFSFLYVENSFEFWSIKWFYAFDTDTILLINWGYN